MKLPIWVHIYDLCSLTWGESCLCASMLATTVPYSAKFSKFSQIAIFEEIISREFAAHARRNVMYYGRGIQARLTRTATLSSSALEIATVSTPMRTSKVKASMDNIRPGLSCRVLKKLSPEGDTFCSQSVKTVCRVSYFVQIFLRTVKLVKFKTCENLALYVTMDATKFKVQHCQYFVKKIYTLWKNRLLNPDYHTLTCAQHSWLHSVYQLHKSSRKYWDHPKGGINSVNNQRPDM